MTEKAPPSTEQAYTGELSVIPFTHANDAI